MANIKSPPFVTVEGIHNFRDAGGYALPQSCSPAASIRRGYVYRCADPSRITDAGRAKIQELGITTVFDLRSKPEIEKQAAKGPAVLDNVPGVTRKFTPAFADQDYSPESIAIRYKDYASGGPEGFTRAYRDILNNAGPSFRTILLHVRDRPDEPFVCHCSAGKDRTGVIVALLLKLAGAEDEVVASEYELTEKGLGPMREYILVHLLQEPSLQNDRAKAERMVASKADYMLRSLEMLRAEFGGADGYAKQHCGLNDEDLATIKKNLSSSERPTF